MIVAWLVMARYSSILACAIFIACVIARLSEESLSIMCIESMWSTVSSIGGLVVGSVSGSSNGFAGSVSRYAHCRSVSAIILLTLVISSASSVLILWIARIFIL